jgi:guanylate kinase
MSLCASKGLLFVISGPSGAGKGTLLQHLSNSGLSLNRVLTYTTREPRANETAEDYTFVTRDAFFELVNAGEIWEHTQTYGDHYYGSPKRLLEDDGSHLLTEVEVKGMFRLRSLSARRVVGIFVLPPSIEELEARIQKRHAEVNSQQRIERAKDQIGYAAAYDYILLNKDMAEFLDRAKSIAEAELLRSTGVQVLLEHYGDALLRS